MSAEAILSIGVYGFTEHGFFNTLRAAQVDLFCDVRARRGLRGSEYAFANAKRLESRLSELSIAYIHLKELAPTQSIRDAQRAEDARVGELKRTRDALGEVFKTQYHQEFLDGLCAAQLLSSDLRGAKRPVFFCVERQPSACHRSLITGEVSRQTGLPIEHLLP